MPKDTTQGSPVSTPKRELIFKRVLDDGTLLEAVLNPNRKSTSLLVIKDGKIEQVEDYFDKASETIYSSDYNQFVTKNSLILPSGYNELDDIPSLLSDVKKFIHTYSDVSPGFEEIAARYVMLSWGYERFGEVPYLRVKGLAGTGKTNFLTVMRAISYHPIYVGAGVTNANLFRPYDMNGGGTLLFDEANFSESNNKNLIVQILNEGYQRNGLVSRINQRTYKPEVFNVFGCKAIASHSHFQDPGLESRFFSYTMQETNRKDMVYSLPEFEKWSEADHLRGQLLSFRAYFFHRINPDLEISSLSNYNARLREILRPLYQVTGETTISSDVSNFLKDHQEDQKVAEQNTDKGLVVKAAIYCAVENKTVTLKDLTQVVNQFNVIEMSDKHVSSILRIIGFYMTRLNGGWIVHLNSVDLNTLSIRYGYSLKPE